MSRGVGPRQADPAAFEQLGEPFNLGWSLYSMGETDVSLGHHDEAQEHFERGIRLFADGNDLSAVVMFMAGFAAVAVLQGDGERAARLQRNHPLDEPLAEGRLAPLAELAEVLVGLDLML